MEPIQCPACFNLNPPGTTHCHRCSADLAAERVRVDTRGFQAGQTFANRYVLKRFLGDGGMGEVWLAEQTIIGRYVAIKFMHPELMRHPTARQRVLAEGRLLGQMNHSHVVSIVDMFETRDTIALVLEYIEGGSLAARVEARGMLLIEEVVEITLGALKGLQALHDQGMVHRDVKPDNVLLASDQGRLIPKIADLGIAHQEQGTRLTRDGSRLGTPEYMAPEQIRGREATFATDIYACGIMMFEMLSGRVPFGGSDFEIQSGHVNEEVDLSKLPSNTPNWLYDVIRKSTSKDPKARFRDAESFRRAIKSGAGREDSVPPAALDAAFRATEPSGRSPLKEESGPSNLVISAILIAGLSGVVVTVSLVAAGIYYLFIQ